MQLLHPISFFKNDKELPCNICKLSLEDIKLILTFQEQLCFTIKDKDTFVPLSLQEWEYLINHGFALGVFPQNCPQRPAYLIGCLYPPLEENLGVDIGLTPEELACVAHLEIAMADPDFRGYKMHSKMCQLCAEHFIHDGRTHFIMSTVSPQNIPSLKALQSAGLQPVIEKEKYGGKLRYIMLRKV